jgi:CheY-like chemotaxis protein
MPGDTAERVILVVEDEWILRDEIAFQFKAAGWKVLEASTGESAIGLLNGDKRIDVLLTDIQLAGELNGWDVAEAFRAARPDIPVIYASGNAAVQSRLVAGGRFFGKPFRISALIDAAGRA